MTANSGLCSSRTPCRSPAAYLARVAVAGLVFHRTGSATLTARRFRRQLRALPAQPVAVLTGGPVPAADAVDPLRPGACGLRAGLILVPGLALPFVMALLFLEAMAHPVGSARLALLTDILDPRPSRQATRLIPPFVRHCRWAASRRRRRGRLIGVRPTLAFDAFTFLVSAAIVVVRRRSGCAVRTRRVTVSPAHRPRPGKASILLRRPTGRRLRPGTWVSTVEGVRSVVPNPKMVQLFALLGLGPAMAVITEGLAVPFAADLGGGSAGGSHHGCAAAGHGDRAVRARAAAD